LAAKVAYEQNLGKYKGSSDFLVRPGLLANRKDKTVRIWAKATGIPSSDPLEFLMIPPDSGRDYEALAVAFVKPSDVHAAIEFIGLKAGRPINYLKDQYWPKGERVIINVEWDEPADGAGASAKTVRVQAEDFVRNVQSGKTLPRQGFIFTGSYWINPPDGGKPLYAADETDSRSIVSDFNDPSTVLDLPRQATKGAVYGSQQINPLYKFTAGQPLNFILEPEYKDGKLRVRDLALRIGVPAGAAGPQGGRYALTDAAGKKVGGDDSLLTLLASFGEITDAGQDPYVTVQADDGLTLRTLRDVYAMLMKLDNDGGIRIEAAPAGNLYYRAFFPKDEWRDRTKRLGRPWELHLVEKSKSVAGTLILPADEIDDNGGQGDLKWTVGTAEEAAKILAEKSGRFSQVVYIFAPGNMTYGQLMAFIGPAMKTNPMMYVFLPKPD
jgi:hypothetical protein